MIRHVPEQYTDFASALMVAAEGDEIVLNTSTAVPLLGLTSGVNNITVRAGTGKTPVLDHSDLPSGGIGLTLGTATGWLFQGIVFRDRNGGSASLSCQGAMDIEDCVFEGCDFALRGNWAGTVSRTDFRSVLQYVSTTNEDGVRFEACRFISCEVVALLGLAGAGSIVENCTIMRCRAGNLVDLDGEDLIAADVIRACTAQECQALDPVSSRAIFNGATACANNNAWLCTADDLFAGAGLSGNTEVDPQHVHPLMDLRLLPTSALVGGGGAATTTLDRFSMPFLVPPNVGAHESARIASVTSPSLTGLVVEVDGGIPDLEACLDRESWRIETEAGVRVAVLEVAQVDDEDAFTLTLHPEMSTGEEYTVRLSPGLYGYDEEAVTPDADPPDYPWRKYRNIAAVMNAVGLQLMKLVGRASAELASDFLPSDQTIFVNSTLNFPENGALWLRDFRITYTEKTDGAFHGVVSVLPRLVAVPAGTVIVSDDRAYVPPAG